MTIKPTITSTKRQIESLISSNLTQREPFNIVGGGAYFLSEDILYACDKYDEGATVVRMAINKKKQLFVLKSITIPHLNEDSVDNYQKIESLKASLEKEIAVAYRYEQAPHEVLIEKKTDKHTEFSFILSYQGYSASMVINSDENPENIISLSSLQYADMAIQFIERVLEVYRNGEVHRDIKAENFSVEIKKNDQLHVSIIDFGSLKKLTHHFSENDLGYHFSKKLVNRPENLPPVYHRQRQHDTVYYESFATDLYAALIAAEGTYKKLLLSLLLEANIAEIHIWNNRINTMFSEDLVHASITHVEGVIATVFFDLFFNVNFSMAKRELYKRLGNFIFTTKKIIENSHLVSLTDYSKLNVADIVLIEEKLFEVRENLLKIEMERNQLKKHAFNIAQRMYVDRWENGIFSLQDTFFERLSQNLGYQAIEHSFSLQFPEERDQLSPEAIEMWDVEHLKDVSRIFENVFFQAAFHHSLAVLKGKLKEIQQRVSLPDLQKKVKNIQQILKKIHLLLPQDTALEIGREVYEILEIAFVLEADDFKEWYRLTSLDYDVCDERFEPKEMKKAAGAIAYIYEAYIQSVIRKTFIQIPRFTSYLQAVQYFQAPENYELAKKLYVNFELNQPKFESHYPSTDAYYDRWREVFIEESCERLFYISHSGYLTLGRIYNEAAVDNVIKPWKTKVISNQLLTICRQEGKRLKSVYLTQQVVNKQLLMCLQEQFFQDAKLFKDFFLKLKNYIRLRQKDIPEKTYEEFLYNMLPSSIEGFQASTSYVFYENCLAIGLAITVLFQPQPKKGVVAAQILAERVILLGFSNKLCPSIVEFWASVSQISTELVADLVQSIRQVTETLEAGRLSENYTRQEDKMYEVIIKDYQDAYLHRLNDDDNSQDGWVRKTFPSYQHEKDILDPERMEWGVSYFNTTKYNFFSNIFWPELLRKSENSFFKTYYTWLRLFVHPAESGHFGYDPKKNEMLKEYSNYYSEHHEYYLDNYYFKGHYVWDEKIPFPKKINGQTIYGAKKILNEEQSTKLKEMCVPVLHFWMTNRYPCSTSKEILFLTSILCALTGHSSYFGINSPFDGVFNSPVLSGGSQIHDDGLMSQKMLLERWPLLLHDFHVVHERNKNSNVSHFSENNRKWYASMIRKNDIIIDKIFHTIKVSEILFNVYCAYLFDLSSVTLAERCFLERNFIRASGYLMQNSATQRASFIRHVYSEWLNQIEKLEQQRATLEALLPSCLNVSVSSKDRKIDEKLLQKINALIEEIMGHKARFSAIGYPTLSSSVQDESEDVNHLYLRVFSLAERGSSALFSFSSSSGNAVVTYTASRQERK